MVKVFKQCRRPLVALASQGLSPATQRKGSVGRENICTPRAQVPQLPGCREWSRAAHCHGRKTGQWWPWDTLLAEHWPLSPLLSQLSGARARVLSGKGQGHTLVAEYICWVQLVTHSWPGGGTSGPAGVPSPSPKLSFKFEGSRDATRSHFATGFRRVKSRQSGSSWT